MIEWWLGRHSSSMRSGLCVELWSGHGETKSQSVVNVPNACFNVEAVIEIEGFKVGPKRSHVALRHLRIERSKSRSSSSSSSSSEPFAATDFELALVFDKPGQYTVPITDITRIRCKYLQQGDYFSSAPGALPDTNARCRMRSSELGHLIIVSQSVRKIVIFFSPVINLDRICPHVDVMPAALESSPDMHLLERSTALRHDAESQSRVTSCRVMMRI